MMSDVSLRMIAEIVVARNRLWEKKFYILCIASYYVGSYYGSNCGSLRAITTANI